MKRLVLGLILVAGCAPKPIIRRFDVCRVTEVEHLESDPPAWRAKCVNQWQLRQDIVFHEEIQTGDDILYVPYKENEMGELHGYIHKRNRAEP